MPTQPPPIELRIAFAKAVIDETRLRRDTHRRDSFDGRKLWDAEQEFLDGLLAELFALVIERDGIDIPDAPEPLHQALD